MIASQAASRALNAILGAAAVLERPCLADFGARRSLAAEKIIGSARLTRVLQLPTMARPDAPYAIKAAHPFFFAAIANAIFGPTRP